MKFRFLIKTALKLYRRNFGQAFIVISAAFFVTVAFMVAVASYSITQDEFSQYYKDFTITFVFDRNISENDLTNELVSIKNNTGISDIILITPAEAVEEFKRDFGDIPSDILDRNIFRPVAIARVDSEIKDRDAFSILLRHLNNNIEAEEILYKSEFVDSYFDLKDKFSFIYIFLNCIIFSGLSFFLFIALKRVFRSHQEDYSLMLGLGSGRVIGIMPQLFFILYTSIIGIVLGLGASIIVWFSVYSTFHWNNFDYNKIFLFGLILSASYLVVITMLSGLFSLKRRAA